MMRSVLTERPTTAFDALRNRALASGFDLRRLGKGYEATVLIGRRVGATVRFANLAAVERGLFNRGRSLR